MLGGGRSDTGGTVLDRAVRAPHRSGMAPAELAPAVAATLEDFCRHLELERGRSAHTVRATSAAVALSVVID